VEGVFLGSISSNATGSSSKVTKNDFVKNLDWYFVEKAVFSGRRKEG
jgi:hypothetical protein